MSELSLSSPIRGVRLAQAGASLLRIACAALALAASGCARTTSGEFTALDCSNKLDDDHDDLKDCDDPDCWVFCPPRTRTDIGGPASGMKQDAGADSGEPVEMPDAGKRPPMSDDDAGGMMTDPGEDDDAGMSEPPPKCECAANEVCTDEGCKQVPPIDGDYLLSVRSAYVPLGRTADTCFDYTNLTCNMRSLVFCDCEKPDPYVDVLLNDKPILDAMTPDVLNNQNPVWPNAPTVRVSLKASDTLTFAAFDFDGIGADQAIFSCAPDLSALATGSDVLSCNPKPGTTVKAPAGTNYYITAQARKIMADAPAP